MTVIDTTTQQNIDFWLHGDFDETTKEKVRSLVRDHPQEAINAFYTNLTFGTGGLRGLVGVGSNRINIHTIMKASQGLANYILKQPPKEHSVIIGFDSRNQSREFAEAAAKVLAANGIRVYLFEALRPTPEISFGCRLKQCTAGIVITASHNPPQYNGLKVYWSDGGQVVHPHDKGIITEVIGVSSCKTLRSIVHPLIEQIGDELDSAYLDQIMSQQLCPSDNKNYGHRLKVVYTSLHGTGITLVPQALAQRNFVNLTLVQEQCFPDGEFPNAPSTNPEDPEALILGMKTLENIQGDLLIATDPDADRMAAVVSHEGKMEFLTGHQIACLCVHHICEALPLPSNGAFIKTYVTTDLFQAIVDSFHRPCFNVDAGFKNIAAKISEWENSKNYAFIFGAEESGGYLLGSHVRDKDAIQASVLLCEVALQAKLKGKTLIDMLHDLYRKYGVYIEKTHTLRYSESKCDREAMMGRMKRFRENPPSEINGINVKAFESHFNTLCLTLEDGTKLMVRASGTEPKIKLYCSVRSKETSNIDFTILECTKKAERMLISLKQQCF